MQVTNINQCIHEQAPAYHCLMLIQQASLYLPHKTHSYKKQKKISSVLIQQKSRRLSTAGASIKELEYTSNPFEWILNS